MHARRLIVPALIPAAFFAGTFASTGLTQQRQASPAVVVIDYMKVADPAEAEYLRLEQDLWKPVHQERIRRGTLQSWTLYEVRYPYGTGNEYNYVTVNKYKSIADVEVRQLADILAKVHPNLREQDLRSRTSAGRQLVRGEVWYQVDHVQ